ncbi:bifunctional diaminohydroxyphosphoribosylaminopyrimidine deaminase/5-amino-6-(5-phosphoribosylamino)uracil reductase RibD [Brevibacillus sp. H7]|uniref:bifunctional diaminohydroxyphosphoribosylaminopyrimidine deaminase/5-amino-6-(5-phosphoribosylamino)uracil reductase RibD n=1 Tax=Brevibacillus sp. H7 TaxID=3349138 RepID=UPI0038247C81
MNDIHYMSLALQLAKGTAGQTSPNPMVGAVVVKDGIIVGMGAHLRAGEPHAEVHALRMAGEKAKGAVIYVTLEPCSHHGRTPPCVDAVIAAGISRVVIAVLDPNPLVAGRGAARLREAGLEVTVGVLEAEARRVNEVFFHYITTGRPFVTVKTASTLDGKIATQTGHSRWITGEEARKQVHELRRQHDAILVGVNTVIADDPALTVRLDQAETGKQPVRVILDTHLRIPLTARVVSDEKAPTWIFTAQQASLEKKAALAAKGVQVISLEAEKKLPIEQVLATLGQRGITSLLVEGGAAVNGAFLQAQAIQKIISYVSMKLVGGGSAPTPIGGTGIDLMGDAVLLRDMELEQVGERDIRISGYPVWASEQTKGNREV